MADGANTYGQRLATLDPETGERPSSRIGNAGNARSLIQRLKYEDQTRMYRYTRIQGLMDGNPPWPAQRLIDIGQGHRANFNLRESEGIVEAAKTPYYDLVFEVPFFARIEFGLEGTDPNLLQQWSDIVSEEYTETLAAWDGFDHQIQLHQWQMCVNGIGPIFWPHYIGWQSEALKCRKVLVPQETKANVDELELAAILHSYRADELESFIKRGGTLSEDGDGWNIPLCKQAIIDSAFREMRQQYGIENYDLYQRAIRTGDLFYGISRSSRIFVASLFVKEFGGMVSHYMITDSVLGTSQSEAAGANDLEQEVGYLFKRRKKFNSFKEVLCPFFYDSGPDGTWHSVKGLGPKIYDFCDVSNRTFCQMLDGAVIGSGLTLETQDSNAIEETQIALVGGATVVSPGYKVVQTRIAESLNGAMTMRRELQNILQTNTGTYMQREDQRPQPTYGQEALAYQKETLLTKGATNRYYNSFDKWHRETLRRLLDPAQTKSVPGGEEALNFRTRCVLRGVPEEVLDFDSIRKITSTRSLGYGSPQLRDIATKELVALIPYMDEISRNHALRARAASLPGVGMHSVDAFFPPIEKRGVPNAHAALAVLENNALRQPGGKALVEPQQNHSIHFDTHYSDVKDHLGDQNSPPTAKYIHLEQAGPHLHQHLEALQGDPTRKQEVKTKRKALDELGKITDQLHQQLSEAAQAAPPNGAQPQGQQPEPGDVAKMAKVQGDLALKGRKQQADLALKTQKQTHAQRLADLKTAADIRRGNATASASITRTKTRIGAIKKRTAASMEEQQQNQDQT